MSTPLPDHSVFAHVRAVIFDVDGTLIDSLGIWNTVDVTLVKELGHEPFTKEALCAFREKALLAHASDENPYIGYCADMGKLYGSKLTGSEIHQIRHRISRKLLREDMRLRPGVAEVVKQIRALGIRTAIATTTKRANIDIYDSQNPAIMSELCFSENFPIILTRESVSRIKPDLEIYLKALQHLELKAEDCLVFEDSLAGVSAAHAAGIPVCSIAEPWSENDFPAIRPLVKKHFSSWSEVLTELLETKEF